MTVNIPTIGMDNSADTISYSVPLEQYGSIKPVNLLETVKLAIIKIAKVHANNYLKNAHLPPTGTTINAKYKEIIALRVPTTVTIHAKTISHVRMDMFGILSI